MGCDIHSFLEVKKDGHWVMIDKAHGDRCYAVFEKMAGVRGNEKHAIARPKGLPTDLSEAVRLHWEDGEPDWHTPSWLSSEECQKLEDWLHSQYWAKDPHLWAEEWTGWLFGNNVGSFTKYRKDYPEWIEDVRVVFWFDN